MPCFYYSAQEAVSLHEQGRPWCYVSAGSFPPFNLRFDEGVETEGTDMRFVGGVPDDKAKDGMVLGYELHGITKPPANGEFSYQAAQAAHSEYAQAERRRELQTDSVPAQTPGSPQP